MPKRSTRAEQEAKGAHYCPGERCSHWVHPEPMQLPAPAQQKKSPAPELKIMTVPSYPLSSTNLVEAFHDAVAQEGEKEVVTAAEQIISGAAPIAPPAPAPTVPAPLPNSSPNGTPSDGINQVIHGPALVVNRADQSRYKTAGPPPPPQDPPKGRGGGGDGNGDWRGKFRSHMRMLFLGFVCGVAFIVAGPYLPAVIASFR